MKFPVFRTVLGVFDYCWRKRRLLVRFGALPFALNLILAAAMLAINGGRTPLEVSGMFITFTVIMTVLYLPLTVTWYRIVVFGEGEATNRPLFTLGRRELRLLGWQVALILVAICGAVGGAFITRVFFHLGEEGVFAIIAVLWTAAWVISLALTVVRLTLILALVSVDQPVNLKIVWKRTRGMSWRLAACIIFLVTLAAIAVGLLFRLVGFISSTVMAMIAGHDLATALSYMDMIAQNVLGFLSLILTATLFGFVYNMLTTQAMSEAQGEIYPSTPPNQQFHPTEDSTTVARQSAPATKARLINGAVFLYLWLSYALKPAIVPEGGDYWAEKVKQLFRFGPFDDIPRLLGQGVFLLPIWLVVHLLLGRMNKKNPSASSENQT
jgi:hypothetical protein